MSGPQSGGQADRRPVVWQSEDIPADVVYTRREDTWDDCDEGRPAKVTIIRDRIDPGEVTISARHAPEGDGVMIHLRSHKDVWHLVRALVLFTGILDPELDIEEPGDEGKPA